MCVFSSVAILDIVYSVPHLRCGPSKDHLITVTVTSLTGVAMLIGRTVPTREMAATLSDFHYNHLFFAQKAAQK